MNPGYIVPSEVGQNWKKKRDYWKLQTERKFRLKINWKVKANTNYNRNMRKGIQAFISRTRKK
jgi:hypothetical protein